MPPKQHEQRSAGNRRTDDAGHASHIIGLNATSGDCASRKVLEACHYFNPIFAEISDHIQPTSIRTVEVSVATIYFALASVSASRRTMRSPSETSRSCSRAMLTSGGSSVTADPLFLDPMAKSPRYQPRHEQYPIGGERKQAEVGDQCQNRHEPPFQ